jgi:S-adenosylmethionine hydrolase
MRRRVPILTLTTDFGSGSPYVAAMKGVILSLNPAATLVDLSHAVPPQDVRYAAVALEDVAGHFPAGTIHVAVVDPGVGGPRALVYARIADQHYLAPDNGLLSRVARRGHVHQVVQLTEADYWLKPLSATFHGRDILAPVAARLSLGLDPARLGVPHPALAELDWPEVRLTPRGIDGSVLVIDSFGNLVSDITAEMLAGHDPRGLEVRCKTAEIRGLARTYGDAAGELVALIGSTGRLEVAVVGGNAAARLRCGVGEPLGVRWS